MWTSLKNLYATSMGFYDEYALSAYTAALFCIYIYFHSILFGNVLNLPSRTKLGSEIFQVVGRKLTLQIVADTWAIGNFIFLFFTLERTSAVQTLIMYIRCHLLAFMEVQISETVTET